MDIQDRHRDEIAFFDKAGSRRLEATSDYRIARLRDHAQLFGSIEHLRPALPFLGELRGKRVLDMGCGNGWITLSLGASGAQAVGIDISPQLMDLASRFAVENGLGDRVTFAAMPCEETTFADATFDCVIMHAALHHCDIPKTIGEVQRVLMPGGKAVFVEDYAYHPLMRLYRRLSPSAHTRFEKALTEADVAGLVSRFSSYTLGYHGLLNLFSGSQSRWLSGLAGVLSPFDRFLFARLPATRRYAKLVSIFVVK